MNGLDEEQMGPQTFLYGCELKAGKDVVFNPEDDDFEHQLDLRMVCMDSTTSDELHVVEVEGQDMEGQKVTAVLASLKPSTLPSVCIGGFAITPPAVFRLKAGSGPIHISGQHLVMMGGDQSFDEEDDEEEEEEVQTSKKRPASAPALKSLKKIKMEEDMEGEEEEEDEDEDEDDDDEDEESEEEESPVKPKKTPSKPAQNGKNSKANTPAAKPVKTPDSKGKGDKKPQTPKAPNTGEKKPQTPKTPHTPLTVPELKAKMMASVEKGTSLPKLQPKFENYLKNGMKVSDPKIIQELWKWRQTVNEGK